MFTGASLLFGESMPLPPSSYSAEQLERFRASWSARSGNRKLGFALFVGVMVVWILCWTLAPDFMHDLPNTIRLLLLGGPCLILIWYLREQSRCPACKVVISSD